MGLALLVAPEHRPWSVNAVCVPAGVDDMRIRRRLLDESNIDIAGGLGLLKGQLWRIGLMGSGSTRENVNLALEALHGALNAEGYECDSGLAAAEAVYEEHSVVTV
jgi:alanine-glyoxylate transaminase/serine-glyoxylate transaminase/serine-pyruvate transaminase